jgi:SnoaL-like domain
LKNSASPASNIASKTNVPVTTMASPSSNVADKKSDADNQNTTAPQLTAESRNVLNAWVQAQNSRSFSTYQACYDPSFVGVKTVKNGHSKTYNYSSWMADRQRMLAQAVNLSVEMSNLRVRVEGDTAVAEFDQYYRSLKYSDWGPKEIRIKMTPSGPKIVYEILKDSHPL